MSPQRRMFLVKLVLAVGGLAVLYELPLLSSRAQVTKFSTILCIALAALGLNLLTGYNGQISIGHGAFFGIGAYTTAILVQNHGWSYWSTLVLGAIITFIVGLLVGLPALRIRGVYLALVTLALATLFPQLILRFPDVTGGSQGIEVETTFEAPAWSGLKDNQWTYYVILVITVVAFVLVRNLVRSRVGRALVAMRDNETAAEVVGVNLSVYKVITFGVSAMLAGIGGSLSVFNIPHVDANQFTIALSITILVAVVVGGAATIFGPAIGAYFVVSMPEWVQTAGLPKPLTPVIFGALLILLMAVAPGGIIGLFRQCVAWIRARTGWGSAAPPDVPRPDGSEPVASSA